MLWGALIFAGSAVALANGTLVVRAPPVGPDDDPFGDEVAWDEVAWDEAARGMGRVAVALGAAGCVVGVAVALG
ncbi:hypothetical protein [Rubrivirga sp.]|uniref:hypothetical protein n=1 Tax=Rubrivirga sp. TaxID=1885344 RepID=UPI003B51982C